jgi:hypothetical protein
VGAGEVLDQSILGKINRPGRRRRLESVRHACACEYRALNLPPIVSSANRIVHNCRAVAMSCMRRHGSSRFGKSTGRASGTRSKRAGTARCGDQDLGFPPVTRYRAIRYRAITGSAGKDRLVPSLRRKRSPSWARGSIPSTSHQSRALDAPLRHALQRAACRGPVRHTICGFGLLAGPRSATPVMGVRFPQSAPILPHQLPHEITAKLRSES